MKALDQVIDRLTIRNLMEAKRQCADVQFKIDVNQWGDFVVIPMDQYRVNGAYHTADIVDAVDTAIAWRARLTREGAAA